MTETRTGFMCQIAFDCEIGNACSTEVYSSVKSLLLNHDCANECGIVEVEVTLKRIIVEGQI